MSVSPEPCPASDVLEGIAAGWPPPPGTGDHLAQCERCRRALERIREDNQFLSSFLRDGAVSTASRAVPVPRIEVPGYDIVREVHHGGQGVVYQAVQRSTKRDVAIKVMKQGPFATLADRARFDREIETLGKLNHPNIVTVHDAGTVAGFQYFVMNYIDGQPLDEAIRDLTSASSAVGGVEPPSGDSRARFAAALELFIKVCDAVHAAHVSGVIHRDLKPSNIRVDRHGQPHILDFGLAKPTDAPRDSAMTQTGQFVGSLPWAAPEQVEGAWTKIDPRSDVYSLGAVLFQVLTGVLPFDVGSSLRDAIDSILLSAPPRPSAIAHAGGPHIDDELDTITLKCLSKERERRYQSAADLASDLRRYLAGEAIEAKGESAIYVLRKTLRRYRVRVAVAGTFVVVFALLGVVMTVLYRRSAHLEQGAVRSAVSLNESLSQSNIEQGRMAGMLGNMQQAEQLLWQELLIRRATTENAAPHVTDPPGPPEAYWALWELYRRYPCLRTVTPEPAVTRSITRREDGTGLWTVDVNGFVQLLDARGALVRSDRVALPTARGLPTVNAQGSVVFNCDGQRCAIWRRDAAGQSWIELPTAGEVAYVSGDGRRMAEIVGGVAVVSNTDPAGEIARFRSDAGELTAAAFSNDGQRLAARDRRGELLIWDIQSQRLVAQSRSAGPPRDALHNRGDLLFSPDDRRIADAWLENAGRIWDLAAEPPTSVELSERPGDYRVQCFSPDGALLAVGDLGGTLRVFDVRTGQRRIALVAHPGRVWSVAFRGDGRGIWTSGEGELRLWEAGAAPDVRIVRIDGEAFHSVDTSPDGRWMIAGGGLGTLHRIESPALTVSSLAFGSDAPVSSVAVSPDGRHIAAATYANAAYVWNSLDSGAPPLRLAHPSRVSHVSFSPDGARLATACDDFIVRLWRAADGGLDREYPNAHDRIPQVAFDPTGRRLAAAVRTGALLVWNLDTGDCETWSAASGKPLRAVCFSPDGRWLVTAGAERVVTLWDTAGRQRVATLIGHNQEIFCLDTSGNGELIASGDTGGTIRLWHAVLRRPLATLEAHAAAVMSLHFGRDGRSLVSASLDGTLRVWDLTHYAQHIAGNLETQLRRVGADEVDQKGADAWRRWAESVSGNLPKTGTANGTPLAAPIP